MYEDWKILKSEADEKAEEYSQVAEWCNECQEYHIELYIDEDDVEWYRTVKNPEYKPTDDEIREMRARAYAEEVDCITAHIQRLRDENPVPEDEIVELVAERDAKIEEIKERYPYNVDNQTNEVYNESLTL